MINHQDIDLDIHNYIKHKLNEIIVSRENTYENPEYDIEEDYPQHRRPIHNARTSDPKSSVCFNTRPPNNRTKSEAILSLQKRQPENTVQSAHDLLKSYHQSNPGNRLPIRSRQQSTHSLHLDNQDNQSTHPISIPITNLLEEWRIYCDIHSKMHNAALSYYKLLNRCIMLTSVIISAISSCLSLTIVSRNKESETSSSMTTWLVVLNSVSVLSACLITVHRFLNLDETQHHHDLYSDVHLCLSKDIQMNLALQQSHTPIFHSAEEMTKHVKSRLDTLIDKSPSIPQFIVDKVVSSTREAYDFQGIQGPSIQAII